MFLRLGNSISRRWVIALLVWVGMLTGAWVAAPRWREVAIDEDEALLNPNLPGPTADRLFQKAFPDENAPSNLAIVLHRTGSKGTHLEADKKFINDVLEPRLRDAIGLTPPITTSASPSDSPFDADAPPAKPSGPVLRLRTPNASGVGELLTSPDHEALLVVVELSASYMSEQNFAIIRKVEKALADLESERLVPSGLEISLTGSAVVGRDQRLAERRGARSTETLTIVLVIALLLLIYRAPIVALIPLLTVAIAVKLSLSILAIAASYGIIGLFSGVQVYVTILAYGAGVDFTLFLIARYKEGLDAGQPTEAALTNAISTVGPSITASAMTVICGLGTLALAEFGKFREAGIAITFSLVVVWLAALTLSPALLRLAGQWLFWPRAVTAMATTSPTSSEFAADPCGKSNPRGIRDGWTWVISMIACKPATVLIATVVLLSPWAGFAIARHNWLSYNLVGNLPPTAPGVAGTAALEAHFPAGMTGPINVLVIDPSQDFRSPSGQGVIKRVTDRLHENEDQLQLAQVRSFSAPLGFGVAATSVEKKVGAEALQSIGVDTYLSSMGERGARAMRIALVFRDNAFANSSVKALAQTEQFIRDSLPPSAELHSAGVTATVRDLQGVMQRDRGRIEMYVLIGVFIVLVILLRQLIVPVYLLLSVLLSYYAALGVTMIVFWALDPTGFFGLDWKVAVFLFAILIAVGEDYNIFLVARVAEEQKRLGPYRGVAEALVRTGPIISSCGIIMAGTFASLMAGSLREMQQLGFALAFGVLLDTFVVRPILVPAFLVLMCRRKTSKLAARSEPNQSPIDFQPV